MQLRELKARLKYSGAQMADLFGLASQQQWRKYSGDGAPRPMSLPMLFLAGAILLGPRATVAEIFDWCREVGAAIEVTPARVGEPQP
jgi:hypothetical protein